MTDIFIPTVKEIYETINNEPLTKQINDFFKTERIQADQLIDIKYNVVPSKDINLSYVLILYKKRISDMRGSGKNA